MGGQSRLGKWVIFWVVLFVCVAILPSSLFRKFDRLGPGNVDLISFWSSYQLFESGENPYHEPALEALQVKFGLKDEPTKVTWNPPWFFLIFGPLLTFSLGKATVLLLVANTAAFFLIAALVFQERTFLRLHLIGPALIFYPFLQTLLYGQSSMILALLVALSLFAFLGGRDRLAGAALATLSIKPHLILGYAAAIVVLSAIEKRYRIISSAAVVFVVLVMLSYLIVPESLTLWSQKLLGSGGASGQSTLDWKSATLATPLREAFNSIGNAAPAPWIIPTMLGVSVVASIILALKFRVRAELGLALALCSSVALSPYGWVFDSALFLVPMLIVLRDSKARMASEPTAIAALNVLLLIAATTLFSRQADFWFLPIVSATALGGLIIKRSSYQQR